MRKEEVNFFLSFVFVPPISGGMFLFKDLTGFPGVDILVHFCSIFSTNVILKRRHKSYNFDGEM